MDLPRSKMEKRMKYLDKTCYPLTQEYIASAGKKKQNARIVPPFSVQSLQKNTVVQPFPKSKPRKPFPVGQSCFRTYYKRGDLPISMEFDQMGYKVSWRVNISELDYHYFLPMFFEGLTETEHPYTFFTQHGIHDLLMQGPHKVLPVIPQIILPIKNALNTRNEIVIATTLKVLQDLASSSNEIGHALVPYYRQILPPLNYMKIQSKSYNEFTGDDIDYGQQKRENVQDLIQETLEILEKHGGRDAFINIKYMIPTYESCIMN
ncbi:parkin coregulated gene protein homolog [Cimex lectularius]|uniref:Parkin coregulated gene protein homolog n=1 Tax=Cimex lectularius TaxID=79782 RepID=A0A8I6RG92_CIMLE|nr:parkin coregulated gene protein homolog [Cimex lectularius]